jgi:hypothetical protein
VAPATLAIDGPRTLQVVPDLGTAAWIDCAGHLPWGLSGDQRLDDARSLTWDFPAPARPVVGYPTLRVRLSASAPAASLSVKLCDVFPDGTSALVSRGTLDLAYRDDLHGPGVPLEPGAVYDVDVMLDACAYSWAPGQTLRVSIAGADWPNTVAPSGPVALTVRGGSLTLPLLNGAFPEPAFGAGAEHAAESAEGVGWAFHHDVLARTTTATTRSDSRYATPHDGTARELYLGQVTVDRRTFAQRAHADTIYELTWPGTEITVRSTVTVEVTATSYEVSIWRQAVLRGQSISERSWQESIPR